MKLRLDDSLTGQCRALLGASDKPIALFRLNRNGQTVKQEIETGAKSVASRTQPLRCSTHWNGGATAAVADAPVLFGVSRGGNLPDTQVIVLRKPLAIPMSSLKSELFQLCNEVASEFEGWNFVGDVFKNKTLKHTELIVRPWFSFKGGENPMTSIGPAVFIVNKKLMALSQQVIGYKPIYALRIEFQSVRDELQHFPENLRISGAIWARRQRFTDHHGTEMPWPDNWITLAEARSAINGMLLDSIALIDKYYDLSSEENLLNNLPLDPRVVGFHGGIEQLSGVLLCLTHVMRGDFDYVEHYCGDDFKTVYPKKTEDLNKIVAALPDLKRKYAQMGI